MILEGLDEESCIKQDCFNYVAVTNPQILVAWNNQGLIIARAPCSSRVNWESAPCCRFLGPRLIAEPLFGALLVFMAKRKRGVTDTLSPQTKMTHAPAACNL